LDFFDFAYFCLATLCHFSSVLQIILSHIFTVAVLVRFGPKIMRYFGISNQERIKFKYINIHPDTSSYQFQPINDFYWQFESYFIEKRVHSFWTKFRIPDIVNCAGYEILQTLISWKIEYTNCFVITISHTTLFRPWLGLHFEFWRKTQENKTSSTKRVRVFVRFKLISRDRLKYTLSVIPSFELGKVTVKNSSDYYQTADYWEK
jgi:hypothetical protein